MVGGEGLTPSREGARVTITEEKRTVTDGPFAEAKELVAGFWIIEVGSLEEAVEWAQALPEPDRRDDRARGAPRRRGRRLRGRVHPRGACREERMRERIAKLD